MSLPIRSHTLAERAVLLRASCERNGIDVSGYTDWQLAGVIERADKWVGWKRYSASIVARNIIVDGYPHA